MFTITFVGENGGKVESLYSSIGQFGPFGPYKEIYHWQGEGMFARTPMGFRYQLTRFEGEKEFLIFAQDEPVPFTKYFINQGS